MDDLAQRIAKLSPQKRALLELQLLKKKGLPEPIAIVGIGCRFPGAPNRNAFWQLLQNGVDAITPIPSDRWDADTLYDADATAPGKTYCREGGFLHQVDHFDPTFFGIAPREASYIDPQQRVFLEVVWAALEDAGMPAPELSGSQTGVFVGISTSDYGQGLLAGPEVVGTYTTTGLASTMAANRLSYLLNLRGPSLAIDTACSSSLVAVHLACQSLRSGESEVAIAGGVNLILRPELTIGFSKLTALSPDGRCKAFDASANGFVRSEGAGAVILKPLSQAIQAGDPVYAVISGSAVNQDGRSNGLTAPNRAAQEAVIRAAFDQAGLSPHQVDYVEAHGTGTLLGDPIEAKALGNVLSDVDNRERRIPIGSVKSNIGHTEAAAGIASLIKTALCMQQETFVPSLHFHTPNPHIPFDDLPLKVQQQCEPWPSRDGKRTAAVSAFAFGGTNAHVVVRSAPPLSSAVSAPVRPAHVMALSAKSPDALKAQVAQLAAWLPQSPDTLAAICHTANAGRIHGAYRVAVTGTTAADMAAALATTSPVTDPSIANAPAVVFLFTGQGAQSVGMGRQLYETQPVFQAEVDRCADLLAPYLDVPLIDVLFGAAATESRLHQTAYTQPALFVLEYALAKLWQSWGIQPAAVLGHSVGEYVAACIAGVLSLEDALRLIAQRGKLMQSLAVTGTMAAVFADEVTVAQTLAQVDDLVAIATLNGPANTVIAGTESGIETALQHFKAEGIRTQLLQVSHAFHSPLLEPILPVFEHMAHQADYKPAQIPLALNVTGKLLQPGDTLDAAYWRRHARQAVRFADGLQALYQEGFRHFLELGPHPVLCGMGRRCLTDPAVQWLPTLRRDQADWTGILASLGKLYEAGCTVDWASFDQPYGYQRRHGLPTYPFQRQRYWVDLPEQISTVKPVSASEAAVPDCLYEIVWKISPQSSTAVDLTADRWLVFTDEQGTGQELIHHLRSHGAAVVTVRQGQSFKSLGNDHFVLDPANPEDFAPLLAAIPAAKQSQRQRILYLWGLDQAPDVVSDLQSSGAGLLHLVQTLVTHLQGNPSQLWVVTQNTQSVAASGESIAPLQAPLWGMGSTIALEHPELWGGLVDLEGPNKATSRDIEVLLAHVTSPDAEDRVALRQGHRWGARLHPISLPGGHLAPLTIHRHGTYLITGGLGALGLKIAQCLVQKGAQTLVLLSRRGERPEHLSTLTALRQAGVTVQVEAVDVAETEDVVDLVQDIQATLPPLRGIVHAAGTLADGLLMGQTWPQFQTVLRPKVEGAWNLHQAVQGMPLDFFVLFSSAASLLGSPGQSNYAAANAFLDALAHRRRQQGQAAQTLNWGPWQGDGLATQHQNTMQRFSTRGVQSFAPDQGIRLFEAILGQRAILPPQVGVLQVDWTKLIPQLPMDPVPAFFLQIAGEASSDNAPDRLVTLSGLSAGDRARHLQRYLQTEVAQVLGRSDTIAVTSNLLDIGLDSLMVMDLLGLCKRDLGLTLYPREVFEHPTLESLSLYLAQELERPTSPLGDSATSVAPPSESAKTLVKEFSVPIWGRDRTFSTLKRKNPPAVFLLSSPRSGSTLLRVMLAGHPDLFCPPELHLLPFETLAERQAALAGSYLDQGLQRALMALKDLDADASDALLSDWTERGMTVPDMYHQLQTLAGNRVVVDKSPTYGFSLSTLRRAEAVFENAKYIHLVRHPYAVIDSFVRNRMDKIFDLPNKDPYLLANQAWAVSNQNILDFLANVDPNRHYFLRYEDLVADPETIMDGLCHFLGIPFDERVLNPYRHQQQRMTDGVKAQSLPIDDPNFHRRRAIDPTLADAWKSVMLPVTLTQPIRPLAYQLQYELPDEPLLVNAPSPVAEDPLSTLQEQPMTVRGLDLCMCTWGPVTGIPVLCLHGVLNQGAIWDAIASALVQQGYRILAPDLRGHGKSAHVGPDGNYQLLDHLGDVDALVRQLGLEACHVVGHSMGAVIAAAYASARPRRTQSLTLVEPVVPGDDSESTVDQLISHLNYLAAPPTHTVYTKLSEAVDRFQKSLPMLLPTWAEKLAARILEQVDGGVRWRWDPRLQVRTRFGLSGGTFTRALYAQLLQRIQAPTTLIFGQQSDFNRPEDLAFQRQNLPQAAVVTVRGGHHLPLESPVEVARELLHKLSQM